MHQDEFNRPYVLSIAGFDPSAGAGVVADAKTMEQCGVYGLTVCSAITVQHESVFESVEWTSPNLILAQMDLLFQRYTIDVCKIGLIENWDVLKTITEKLVGYNPAIKIIVDPIFRASAGFDFHQNVAVDALKSWLQDIYLLTPNAKELARIGDKQTNLMKVAQDLARYCHLLYKGGHNLEKLGTDYLLIGKEMHVLEPQQEVFYDKHGSGCVLSAAIAAHLALGNDLLAACVQAKNYISPYLNSNSSLLGFHNRK